MTDTKVQLTDAEVVAEAIRRLRVRASVLSEEAAASVLAEVEMIEEDDRADADEVEMQVLRALLGVE